MPRPTVTDRDYLRIGLHVNQVSNLEDCWLWNAATTRDGYPVIKISGCVFYVHRLMADLAYGSCAGMDVHHICKNRNCINPLHLQLVDPRIHRRSHLHLTH